MLSSCQILYETHPSHTIDTYTIQPICPLNLATYNPAMVLISAKNSEPREGNKDH